MFQKSIALLLFITLSFVLKAQDDNSVKSEIKEVTVFLNGSQITRTAKTTLNKGENTIRLTGLSHNMDYSSIQVIGNSDFDILSVKGSINYSLSAIEDPIIKLKKDSLADIQFTLSMRMSLENVYYEEKTLLQANKAIKGTDAVLYVEDIEEIADFYRDRMLEIEYKLLELQIEKTKLNQTIYRLSNEINQSGSLNYINTGEVTLKVESSKNGLSNIEFSYVVYGAGWYPVYDLRTEDTENGIEMRYKAKVYQNTGNDWDNIKLTLSTGNPNLGGQAPELSPWYLGLYEQDYLKKQRAQNKTYNAELNQQTYSTAGAVTNMESVMIMSDDVGFMDIDIVNNLVNTEFVINIPYDIPSDNQEYDVEIQRLNIPVQFRHLAVPKMDKDAFLIANLIDWRSYNLLPGESNIYFKGTFVGTAFIDPAITGDTLELSLGRDPSIVIEREMIKDLCKTQNLGLKKKTTKAYKITIKNNKSSSITIRLEDQIPLSNVGEMTVDIEEVSGANYDEETGKLYWDLQIGSGQSKEIEIRYNVKYPRSKSISNL